MIENWLALYAAIMNSKLTCDKALVKMGLRFNRTSPD